MNRRHMLRITGSAGLATAFPVRAAVAKEERRMFSAMGIAAPLAQAAELKKAGAGFLTLSTEGFLVPDQPDEVFTRNHAELRKADLPALACNAFLPKPNLRCVGPDATHDRIVDWGETAFRRMRQAGAKFMVFGSAAARKLPANWTPQQADLQFISLLKRLGPAAAKFGVTIVLEQLQPSECNYINRLAYAARLVRAAEHPNIRLLADLFHIRRVGDTPDELATAADLVAHVEIAELESRSYPGVKGDDFRPFFRILQQSGYHGAINIEGNGGANQLADAFAAIARQAQEAGDHVENKA